MSDRFDVFLCHNPDDKPAVKKIGTRLRDRGIRVWLDEWELTPGRPWQEKVEEQIERISCAAVFIGGSGIGPWQNQELRGFLEQFVKRDCPVIPVLLEDCRNPAPKLPLFLGRMTGVNFRRGDPDPFERLVWGITNKKPQPKYPDSATRELAIALKDAERRRAELEHQGEGTSEIARIIVDFKRKIREGGQLKAGDSLLDGRFELIEPIGSGGFARVWKAYDEEECSVVAVKVLHGQYSEDRTRRERFFRGAHHMARLRHPGIVRVVEEECEDGGFHFFVMELLDGGDFQSAVRKDRLSMEERFRIVLEVGEALVHAHGKGLVHRDVKPSNILLDADGRPKLTDFDLVLVAESTGGTRTAMLGTFLYAAPEAMMDGKAAGEQADVYGLGITTVFAVHGADLPADALWELPELVSGLQVDEVCREVLSRAVKRKEKERWSTVKEFCDALRAGIDSPVAPPWAVSVGQDIHGSWADLEVRGVVQRMRWIPPGEFLMGSPKDEYGRRWERPQHRVKITEGLWLANTPCTQVLWQKVMGKNPSRFKHPHRPVEQVSWYDCENFMSRLNEWIPGLDARFPTEAEWEYACRAGTTTATWIGNPKELDSIAWYSSNSIETREVGQKLPNPWGLYDMLGNVWEECLDWRGPYSADAMTNPRGPEMGERRVSRGGGWPSSAHYLRAAYRDSGEPDSGWYATGFRLALGQVVGG